MVKKPAEHGEWGDAVDKIRLRRLEKKRGGNRRISGQARQRGPGYKTVFFVVVDSVEEEIESYISGEHWGFGVREVPTLNKAESWGRIKSE